jgi:hypothetical protein
MLELFFGILPAFGYDGFSSTMWLGLPFAQMGAGTALLLGLRSVVFLDRLSIF